VLVASFFLQLFALLTPLFTQVVIDKVLVHKGFTTLYVLAVGMIALALFDAIFGLDVPFSYDEPIDVARCAVPPCPGAPIGLFRSETGGGHGGPGS
jgi:hypothetical protein